RRFACRHGRRVGDLPADTHAHDATALGLEHLDVETVEIELLPDHGHAAELRQQVAADRAEALARDVDAQPAVQLGDGDLPAEHEHAVPLVLDGLGLDVVLVPDLADDLLEQILNRNQAPGAAVFVDDDG